MQNNRKYYFRYKIRYKKKLLDVSLIRDGLHSNRWYKYQVRFLYF